tara:strand:- start:159 stop:329 length:171 start_codon:yes stop_codon:yes gene_type:complete
MFLLSEERKANPNPIPQMNKLSIADMEKLKCAREKITAAKTFANTVENTLVLFCLD